MDLSGVSQGLQGGLGLGLQGMQLQEQRDYRQQVLGQQRERQQLEVYMKGLEEVSKNPAAAQAVDQMFQRVGLGPLDPGLVQMGQRTETAVAALGQAYARGSIEGIPPDVLGDVTRVAGKQQHLASMWKALVDRSLDEQSRVTFVDNYKALRQAGKPDHEAFSEALLTTKGALDINKVKEARPVQPSFAEAQGLQQQPQINAILGALQAGQLDPAGAATRLGQLGPAGLAVIEKIPALKAHTTALTEAAKITGAEEGYRQPLVDPATVPPVGSGGEDTTITMREGGVVPPGGAGVRTVQDARIEREGALAAARAEGRITPEDQAYRDANLEIARRNAAANETRAQAAADAAASRLPGRGPRRPIGQPKVNAEGQYVQQWSDGVWRPAVDEQGNAVAAPKPASKGNGLLELAAKLRNPGVTAPVDTSTPGRGLPTRAPTVAGTAPQPAAPPASSAPTEPLVAARAPAQQTDDAKKAEAVRLIQAARRLGQTLTFEQAAAIMQRAGWKVTP